MVDSSVDRSQVFAARVVVLGEHIRTLVEAIGEGHHRNVDEVLRNLGGGQAVEARVDGMVKDGAVLHRKAVDKVLEVVLRVLVEQAKWHGVELAVETHDAEIKAFLGWSGVLGLGFSATGEGGEHDGKCQNCYR